MKKITVRLMGWEIQ